MNEELKEKWLLVEEMLQQRFGEKIDEQTILFVIGLQELGKNDANYSKEEKLDIIHIGICTVLSGLGYYQLIGKDDDDWPHFKNIKKLPSEVQGENQQHFLKEAIINYFDI
ncbi:MAG: hypothetical protein JKX68_02355 [Flavobacteriales bacterium]|nr:hypothetical protein [Flavobacteriales bacterium]